MKCEPMKDPVSQLHHFFQKKQEKSNRTIDHGNAMLFCHHLNFQESTNNGNYHGFTSLQLAILYVFCVSAAAKTTSKHQDFTLSFSKKMQKPRKSSFGIPQNESENTSRFDKSLQELRDLRSQLHYAADYCESTFLNSKKKKMDVDSTKEYICRAVVAVVDHLGCVSANLNHAISEADEISDAEFRIDTLKQRLQSCEQFSHKIALTRVRWHPNLPKFHRRYLSTPILNFEKSNEKVTEKHGFEAEDLPLLLYTCSETIEKDKPTSAIVLPVHDGVSTLMSKTPIPTFHFQQISEKHVRYKLFKKSVHNSDILSLIRRIKRTI
ncbi:probable protein ABIL5 [Mercurialis annua]|uniref:probable protein ABIL5 n=1 Tax=Mercurialis annua TaxID=3986 RepID=UPI00215FD30E|nr:probable protein ABIL5 [Mercurialis annua]